MAGTNLNESIPFPHVGHVLMEPTVYCPIRNYGPSNGQVEQTRKTTLQLRLVISGMSTLMATLLV